MNTQELKEGEAVIIEGQDSNELFILLDGILEVTVNGRVVNYIMKDELFGELALLGETKRTATVRAKEDSLICRISPANIYKDFETLSPAVKSVINGLVTRLIDSTRRERNAATTIDLLRGELAKVLTLLDERKKDKAS